MYQPQPMLAHASMPARPAVKASPMTIMVIATSVLGLLCSFIPYYAGSGGWGGVYTASAWGGADFGWPAALVMLVVAVVVALPLFMHLPPIMARIPMPVAGLAVLLVALAMLVPPERGYPITGAVLQLFCAVAAFVGALTLWRTTPATAPLPMTPQPMPPAYPQQYPPQYPQQPIPGTDGVPQPPVA